jgi:CrcB protein
MQASWTTTALVALAGAMGAVTRYRVGVAVGVRGFPWTTLAINLSGSFVLALLLAGPAATRWSATTSIAIGVGFLGAYTTFSTFSNETLTMLREGRGVAAVAYVALSVLGGLTFAALGYVLGRAIA